MDCGEARGDVSSWTCNIQIENLPTGTRLVRLEEDQVCGRAGRERTEVDVMVSRFREVRHAFVYIDMARRKRQEWNGDLRRGAPCRTK